MISWLTNKSVLKKINLSEMSHGKFVTVHGFSLSSFEDLICSNMCKLMHRRVINIFYIAMNNFCLLKLTNDNCFIHEFLSSEWNMLWFSVSWFGLTSVDFIYIFLSAKPDIYVMGHISLMMEVKAGILDLSPVSWSSCTWNPKTPFQQAHIPSFIYLFLHGLWNFIILSNSKWNTTFKSQLVFLPPFIPLHAEWIQTHSMCWVKRSWVALAFKLNKLAMCCERALC